jgi:predicted nuclease with TOPRIM domain
MNFEKRLNEMQKEYCYNGEKITRIKKELCELQNKKLRLEEEMYSMKQAMRWDEK